MEKEYDWKAGCIGTVFMVVGCIAALAYVMPTILCAGAWVSGMLYYTNTTMRACVESSVWRWSDLTYLLASW
jgi:hypothetical protein